MDDGALKLCERRMDGLEKNQDRLEAHVAEFIKEFSSVVKSIDKNLQELTKLQKVEVEHRTLHEKTFGRVFERLSGVEKDNQDFRVQMALNTSALGAVKRGGWLFIERGLWVCAVLAMYFFEKA